VIFSLEMGRNEITMRLLSAEARVPLHTMRTGTMSDDDWARLARRMGEVAEAPLFIDDSPNMSMMEIRAKCRRLKQRHDLRIVIVDYMQLMSSPKRVENRQQEVSEMSRALKLLAKELDVPVVAISQLNRGPEQRNDKRPLLSDLRESGCMTEDTRLARADSGAPITFRELLDNGHKDVLVWAVDQDHRLVASPITNVFESGVKAVYRLRLASGREVKASANHRFMTFAGWTALEELNVGDRIGIPRRLPEPIGPGRSGELASELQALLDGGAVNPNADTIPIEVWDLVRSERTRIGMTERNFQAAVDPRYRGTTLYQSCPSRGRLLRCADALDSAILRSIATSDIYWDRVVSIEPLGLQPVYDATVKGAHNFIANGIIAHNSIEQDSDVVILLHREDAYERESPRAGEADLIVAKHRNGPTAVLTVAFQGHYSRFVDMAP
jgi:replicative DNA helicase